MIFWRGLPFGQVREDPAVEQAALERLDRLEQGVVIASAGCTGFALASLRRARWTLLDQNPRQLELCALKRRMLLELPREEVLAALDRDAGPALRKLGLPARARRGLNHCGGADRFMEALAWFYRGRAERFLQLDHPEQQRREFQRCWDGLFWRWGWRLVLSRPLLGWLYGALLTDRDFMPRQVQQAMTERPARTNLYLWQALLGRYPPDRLPLYLERLDRAALAEVELVCSEAGAWLDRQSGLDFLALSNILEVTPDEQVARFCARVAGAARSGALVVLRRILPRSFRACSGPLQFVEDLSGYESGCFCRTAELYRVP